MRLALKFCVFLVTQCFSVILLSLCHGEGNKKLSISLQMAFAESVSDLRLVENVIGLSYAWIFIAAAWLML